MTRPRTHRNLLLSSFVTSQLVGDLLRDEFRGTGMQPDRFGVQSVIAVRGPLTPSELAAYLGMSPSTVSSWLNRLDEAGAIERRPNPDDGRSTLIEVTARGREEVARSMVPFRRALARIDGALGSERETVEDAYQRFEQALRDALGSSGSHQL